ncbi:MAG: hypothetical protein WKH68_13115 [Candidatus Limnocylindria bacterium]
MDGGIANNAAISQATALGADRIVVVPAGFACALDAPPATPLSAAIHALTLLIEQRLIVEVTHLSDRAEIIVLPPLCSLSVGAVDFGMTDQLMSRAPGLPESGSMAAGSTCRTPSASSRSTAIPGHNGAAPRPRRRPAPVARGTRQGDRVTDLKEPFE